nr:MAG TPA: hypothetical protein [Caudoviricetes sp.]
MKGYKAFYKNMIFKGDGYEKQYEENTTYEENGNEVCKSGVMHFCENPFDVLNYYPLVDDNCNVAEFAEVEALGDTFKKSVADDKTATNKLHIGAKLNLKGFIKACIDFSLEKTKVENKSSGYYAKLASSGNYAKLASSGNYAQLASSGYCAKLASSGYGAQLASSGDYAKLASSGDNAKLASSGEDSVVCAAGINSIAKAMIGSWITLSEWKYEEDKGRCVPVCVKTEQVDGERIKEDTFYKLENGEFVEVK